ncbi:MAG: ATP-binding cassette domain-containing protein [Kiritimatiellia bacterium]|nr:ATP-binding cassette domain-containing protein [Kiritimatiellia bacterium]MDP6629749.1 ATP-binding cassette domain-containing protein [Kiritimatiellia bacterium]MDP6811025.1 ATP-binding cassette domain-containing protein [Kiritimatiellia bacterium]MDP7023120.1 ATP-binding cassette domain-containing protein [Kiritimatiellia bacterium]
MVDVQNLTKRYPGNTAVDDISFNVQRREIVGFLGPNGAGKTTTMQILAGYLPATGGHVEVAGYDVFKQSLDVRRQIGYLPENVPLYTDMRVTEYLRFRGRLKGLGGARLRARLESVLESCGLTDVHRQIIGSLSRGFRQRVGLADSLIAEPELLILDEPTVGLDPNQIRQIRNLIRGLGERHTVLLASHILHEVEMVCNRVLIINGGQIVASDTPGKLVGLLRGNRRVLAQIRGGTPQNVQRLLEAIPAVVNASCEAQGEWLQCYCESKKEHDIAEDVFRVVAANGWRLRELHEERRNLEDVFAEVTSEDNGKNGLLRRTGSGEKRA